MHAIFWPRDPNELRNCLTLYYKQPGLWDDCFNIAHCTMSSANSKSAREQLRMLNFTLCVNFITRAGCFVADKFSQVRQLLYTRSVYDVFCNIFIHSGRGAFSFSLSTEAISDRQINHSIKTFYELCERFYCFIFKKVHWYVRVRHNLCATLCSLGLFI